MSESPSRLIKIANPMDPKVPHHKVSGKAAPVRIFRKDWMESLTLISFRQFLIFCVVVDACSIFLTKISNNSIEKPFLFSILGLLIWFIFEYLLHRFIFHFTTSNKTIQNLVYIFHGNHHIQPNHPYRTLMPLAVTIPIGILIFFIFYFSFGLDIGSALFTGFFSGYVFYDTVHYSTHNFSMKKFPLSLWKKHHLLHHYMAEEHNYSITVPWLDILFCTKYQKNKR